MSIYAEQSEKAGLNIPETWRGDYRSRFEIMFEPILNGSEYYMEKNTTDSSKPIMELWKKGDNGRIMGFWGKRDMRLNVFFRQSFFDHIDSYMTLPANEANGKTQAYIKNISLEFLWNILCIAVNKKDLMVDTDN